jgi:hypothetical protein
MKPQVFISHANEDADSAQAIGNWLETTLLGGVRCFVSSGDSIPLGQPWLDRIQSALGDAAIVLVLVSRESASRPWIHFEAGAGFSREIPVVPICIAGMKAGDLEGPLSVLQAIQLPSPESEHKLLALIAQRADLRPPSAPPPLELSQTRPPRKTPERRREDPKRPRRVFKNADDTTFIDFFRDLVPDAKRVVLVGTGLNVLFRDGPLDLIKPKMGQSWEIYLANPFSPDVEARLTEEETGSPMPPVGRDGLLRRLEALVERQAHLGNDRSLAVRLFSHYPTMSFFIIDEHYFFYPYGFSRLGDFSPVIYCYKQNPEDAPLVKFLDEQYELTKTNAADATLVQELRSAGGFGEKQRERIQNKLTPFAVYLVPEEGTALYDFGTKCLGFDLRKETAVASRWPSRYRGGAEFGFHVTVADALYFAEEQSVTMLGREIQALARQFPPFDLGFELQEGFPDASSISIVCRDDTGRLEALHHEMVFRCYRRAVASNYSPLFGAKADRAYAGSSARTDLMIERYHAPYILSGFQPHFSLFANVKSSKMAATKESLAKTLPTPPFRVNSICLLTKLARSDHWRIRNEFRLGSGAEVRDELEEKNASRGLSGPLTVNSGREAPLKEDLVGLRRKPRS